jgi:hypothetical protein
MRARSASNALNTATIYRRTSRSLAFVSSLVWSLVTQCVIRGQNKIVRAICWYCSWQGFGKPDQAPLCMGNPPTFLVQKSLIAWHSFTRSHLTSSLIAYTYVSTLAAYKEPNGILRGPTLYPLCC